MQHLTFMQYCKLEGAHEATGQSPQMHEAQAMSEKPIGLASQAP